MLNNWEICTGVGILGKGTSGLKFSFNEPGKYEKNTILNYDRRIRE